MRYRTLTAATMLATLATIVQAQDVVVMRRQIAAPRANTAPPVPKGPAELVTNGGMATTANWQSSGNLAIFINTLKIPRGETAYQTTAYQAEAGFTYTVKFGYSAYNFFSNPAQFTWSVTDTSGVVLASGAVNAASGNVDTIKTWGTFKGTGKAVKILITNASGGFCCPDSLLIDNVSIMR